MAKVVIKNQLNNIIKIVILIITHNHNLNNNKVNKIPIIIIQMGNKYVLITIKVLFIQLHVKITYVLKLLLHVMDREDILNLLSNTIKIHQMTNNLKVNNQHLIVIKLTENKYVLRIIKEHITQFLAKITFVLKP